MLLEGVWTRLQPGGSAILPLAWPGDGGRQAGVQMNQGSGLRGFKGLGFRVRV